jgi:hypothetical protein
MPPAAERAAHAPGGVPLGLSCIPSRKAKRTGKAKQEARKQ